LGRRENLAFAGVASSPPIVLAGRAYRSVAHGKTGRSADPLGKFSSRPAAVF
jgi:hypothetical protein